MTSLGHTVDVALLGGGGHAQSVADVLVRLGCTVRLVIAPEADPDLGPLVEDDEAGLLRARASAWAVVPAVGDNRLRRRLTALAHQLAVSMPSVVGLTATVAATARLGDGTVILEHAHVGPGATLGSAVIVNTHATVEHEVTVGDASHVSSAATLTGGVRLGRCVLVGAGAVVLPGTSIGDDATIGAGAVVREDVPPAATVAGVPARMVSAP